MVKKKKSKIFNRYTAIIFVMVGIFMAIIARLVFLQIVNSSDYVAQANTDDTREITIPAQRGDILDSKGSPLAADVQSYVLTYTETEESNKNFFTSMQNVFDLLDKDGEIQKDTFELKSNPFAFIFNTSDPKTEQALELAFKSNRDFRQDVITKNSSIFGKGKKYADLSKAQQTQVDQILLKMTPEETFNALWDRYTKPYLNPKDSDYNAATAKLIKSYSTDQKRRFMLVMDAVWMQSFSGYKPVVIADNIKKETAFTIMQKITSMPGMEVMLQPQRVYPNNNLASSVIGYLSRITGDSQEKYIERGYDVTTDMVGMSGLEAAYEDKLKGSTGAKIFKVDKNGRTVGEEAYMPPTKGNTIQTTINSTVQKAATEALQTQMTYLQANPHEQKDTYTANATRGAVVVQNVNTGAIIACVSLPDFDPNDFAVSGKLTTDKQKQYFSPDLEQFGKNYVINNGLMSAYPGETLDQVVDTLFPKDTSVKGVNNIRKDPYDIYPKSLFNYALGSLVPPGSTFKPAVAIGGLESGVITPSTTVNDTASFDDGHNYKVPFKNDSPNGLVSLTKAITVSSNPYFMTVGKLLRENKGDDSLAEYAWKLGLGVKPNSGTKASTGIELPEAFGQTYNSVSNINLCAQLYLASTMDELVAGKGERGNTFPSIDLYYHSTENDTVHNLKQQIKNDIQDSIRTGNRNKTVYVDLLNKLITADATLKGKTFTSNQIGSIADEIGYEAVDRGHFEATVPANMYQASIGLGMDNFTPMQMAGYIATLVNGGTRYKAHLTDKIMDAEGNVIQQIKPEVLSKANFNPDNVSAIKAGMLGVTGDTSGTAKSAFQNFTIMQTGGKTGTATFKNGSESTLGRTDYAWFVGFAPYDKPEIAVSAVIFDGGYGANAAPIAKAVYEAYFMDQFKKQNFVPDETYMQEMYK